MYCFQLQVWYRRCQQGDKGRHVDVQDGGSDEQDDEIVEMTADVYRYIKASSEGKFRVIKRIGDYVKVNEIIGQIVDRNGDRTDVFSSVSGRIAGSKAENAF
jgi:predicted deacylase